ncbi:MAG: putative membrane protein [Anaerolinea thermophila]|uniref:Putative membrane protein n=1 Tax=Anaerolinea thermophila TaxID=167964 RepID=A0A101FXH9_9CHLR|nr:MAG: putative membrane protein [Anaerolinea thermophila]
MLFGISWESAFHTISQILTAGVAITAFSLLLYSFAYNLREGVVQAFIIILLCVTLVFTAESIAGVSQQPLLIEMMLKLKWLGIIFLPATYLHFADSLLTLTGRPSRGRRLWSVRLVYAISVFLAALLPFNIIVGPYVESGLTAPHLARTFFTDLFAIYYIGVMAVAGSVLYRAFQRTVTKTSRRRMIYLLAGATAAAVGTYPYMLYGSGVFSKVPILYYILVSLSSVGVAGFLVVMTYSVSFFGVTWPDRLVKSRLFKWFLRGPFTASIVLAITTIIRRLGVIWDEAYNAFVPISMVGMILLIEYIITLLAPIWERLIFYGSDRKDIARIQSLGDHLLTRSDLSQFLEIVTASICDLLQVKGAFIAVMNGGTLEMLTTTGDDSDFRGIETSDELLELSLNDKARVRGDFFFWNGHLLIPLIYEDPQNGNMLLGLCGFPWEEDREMEEEHLESINLLAYRVEIALRDWRLQQQVIKSMESLQPQVALIQHLRAASSYNKTSVLMDEIDLPEEDFVTWVKDALSHYWGGPKLTESPLISLNIVQSALKDYDGNPTNALRAILKDAIENIKPEGERRFTGEWILYNILELKFLEGRKVRDVATRLAMSEADLYRKQKVALEAVSKAIIGMELAARKENKS